mmetsp:Transcript_107894/g.240724  ORF Transcript_107894/g.240724 Transcript_107894/m.240724 type:complete len:297 (+) Transcript_107894:58-948(+)
MTAGLAAAEFAPEAASVPGHDGVAVVALTNGNEEAAETAEVIHAAPEASGATDIVRRTASGLAWELMPTKSSSSRPVMSHRLPGQSRRSSSLRQSLSKEFRVPRTLWARDFGEIRIVPDFVSDEEIAHLLSLATWSTSTVRMVKYNKETGKSIDEKEPQYGEGRTSSSCLLALAQDAKVSSIEERLARLANCELDCLEQLNLVKYEAGQFFKPHHDGGHRSTTVFLYLNDLPPQSGGETHFLRLGLRVRPQRGAAVIWNNLTHEGRRDERMVHQGLPPKDARKFGMNCFFRSVPVR